MHSLDEAMLTLLTPFTLLTQLTMLMLVPLVTILTSWHITTLSCDTVETIWCKNTAHQRISKDQTIKQNQCLEDDQTRVRKPRKQRNIRVHVCDRSDSWLWLIWCFNAFNNRVFNWIDFERDEAITDLIKVYLWIFCQPVRFLHCPLWPHCVRGHFANLQTLLIQCSRSRI